MRLLDTRTLKLKTFIGYEIPRYAILSHTWGDDEVLYEDVQTKSTEEWKDKIGAGKILKSAKICVAFEIAYIWIDTCCIDKGSSAELSEAINSMFEWYRSSLVCFAYLSDVLLDQQQEPQDGIVPFEKSRWFTRGWTLQELIAPSNLQFSDKSWRLLGGRSELADKIYSITYVDESVLRSQDSSGLVDALTECSVHTKMVWAAKRFTTRAEDRAYSLLGLFDVNMPLLYGEGGQKAFKRLQDEIIKRTSDQSILLHDLAYAPLANSPDDFSASYRFLKSKKEYDFPLQKTRNSIDISLAILQGGGLFGVIEAYFRDDPSRASRPAIELERASGDKSYQRSNKMIYEVRPDNKGQIEVVEPTGKSEYLGYAKLQREVIRLEDLSNKKPRDNLELLVLPIGGKTALVDYKILTCPRAYRHIIPIPSGHYVVGWQSTRVVHFVECIFLRDEGPYPSPTLAILIFQCQYQQTHELKLHAHIVELKTWLGEEFTIPDNYTTDFLFKQLPRLPFVTNKHENFSRNISGYAAAFRIGEITEEPGFEEFTTSDGVRVTTEITEEVFLEKSLYHLHVDVNNVDKDW
ncbi:HET-domain-containing protein [Xylaria arbuscula]|nr:HET-domain-containing protein [Xylaria arbuscula]